MALIFGDSMGHYPTSLISAMWSPGGNQTSLAIYEDATAVAPYRALGFAGSASTGGRNLTRAVSATEAFVCGFYYMHPAHTAARSIIAFDDGSTEHVSLRLTTSGNITFTRNGTVLATSANTMTTNTWYHVEIKATIGDAADSPSGQYEVRVNGSSTGWIADSGTGQDTRNGGNKSFSVLRLAHEANSTERNYYQHLYLLDTSGSYANNFLGPCRFALAYPVGAGNESDWVGNYADNWINVGEQIADGDVTFNQSSTAGDKDKFTMTDIPSGTVHAVQHTLLARQDGGATRTVRAITRIGGTDYNGTSKTTSAAYAFLVDPVSVSPATSTQWDDAEINGAEFGYELVS